MFTVQQVYAQAAPYEAHTSLTDDAAMWLWFDRTTLAHNQVSVTGALWVDTQNMERPGGYQTAQFRGLAVRVTRSLVANNTVQGGLSTLVDDSLGVGVAVTVATLERSSVFLGGNYLSDNGQGRELNASAPPMPGPVQPLCGAGFALLSRGSLVEVAVRAEANTWARNHAGLGGALFVSSTAQQGLRVALAHNLFENNTAGPYAQLADGGAASIHYGPPLDVRRGLCDAVAGCGAATNETWSPSAPGLSVASRFSLSGNEWRSNAALGYGGALMVYYSPDFFVPQTPDGTPGPTAFPFALPSDPDVASAIPADEVSISGERYDSNGARPLRQAGVGGALSFTLAPDVPLAQAVDYTRQAFTWRTWAPRTRLHIANSSFVSSSALCQTCSGGAVYVRNGATRIERCSFDRSVAGSFGGALFIDSGSGAVDIDSTSFARSVAAQRGQLLYSLSSAALRFNASTLDLDCSAATVGPTQLEIPIGGSLSLEGQSLMQCAAGFSLRNASQTQFRASTPELFLGVLVSSRAYSCVACAPNTYSLARGAAFDDVFVPGRTEVDCRPCPFGADCSSGVDQIFTKQGNWGKIAAVVPTAVPASSGGDSAGPGLLTAGEAPTTPGPDSSAVAASLAFYPCPAGYCCPPGKSCTYDYCSGHRTGVLCSQCQAGYTMALATPNCRAVADCDDARWFWPVAILGLGLGAVAWLGLQLRAARAYAHTADAALFAVGEDDADGAASDARSAISLPTLLRVLMLYWQLAGLLLSSSSKSAAYTVSVWISSISNFQLSNTGGGAAAEEGVPGADGVLVPTSAATDTSPSRDGVCVVTGMSGLDKIAWNYLFPSIIVIWVLLMFALAKAMTRNPDSRLSRWIRQIFAAPPASAPAPTRPSQGDKAGSDETSSAQVGIEMQAMDEAGGGGLAAHDGNKSVVSSSSSVSASVSASSASVPLTMCAFHSPRSGGVDCFLAAVLLELMLACYTSFLLTTSALLQCVDIGGERRVFLAADTVCYSPGQSAAIFFFVLLSLLPLLLWLLPHYMPCSHIARVLHTRYRADAWSQATECVLLLRRYLFVLLSTFVVAPFTRAYLLLLVAVGSALVHQRQYAFRSSLCNLVESVCVASLVALGAIGIRSGAQMEMQPDADSGVDDTNSAMDGLTVALLFAPAASALIATTAQACRLRRMRAAKGGQ